MMLLRFYLEVGGADFDAQQFSIAAGKMGIETGRVSCRKRRELNWCRPDGTSETVKITSGITGADGEVCFAWKTKDVEYAHDAREFYRQRDLPMHEYARRWLDEDKAILEFLEKFRELIPCARDFAKGDYFVLLKLMYAKSAGYPVFSDRVIKLLSELGAYLETDCEYPQLYFDRLKALRKRGSEPSAS